MSTISNQTFVVLDTNLLLHFRQPDQMDWTPVGDDVVLLVLPIVLRELEKTKALGANLRVKQRAGKMVSWLAHLLDDGQEVPLRPGVALRFIGDEPQLDFAIHNLVREVQDDQVVASLIDLVNRLSSAPVLCTADMGLRVKAKQRGFKLHVPPESERLAEESDPKDKELSELRHELQQLRVKVPKLSAGFVDGNLHFKPKLVPVPAVPYSLEQVKLLYRPMAAVEQTPSPGSIGDFVKMFSAPTGYVVELYNKQLEDFFSEYERYLEKFDAWSRAIQRCFLFDLRLTNAGTTPATDVDAIFTFPEGVKILQASKIPEPPKSPVAPEVPKHAFGPLGGVNLVAPRLHGGPMPGGIKHPWVLSCQANRVHLKLDRLKHGFDFSVPQLAIAFSDQGVRSISFQAELTANELSSRIESELHLVF
ncbi:PIN domain-containing protein [Variovorax sp. Varisp62]|uniref:PIN domain-containing protein n=1 Tax=Variovorax sp. Varisp62 TaxID=3243049 RepID=UPI0039B57C3A